MIKASWLFLIAVSASFLACGGSDSSATTDPTTGNSRSGQAVTRVGAAQNETVLFMGHRLEVALDDAGKPIGAKAFDPQKKEVPMEIVPLGDVTVCVPKHPGASAGAKPYCEPLSFLPERISFKSGDKTICYFYSGGQIFYYRC